MKIWKIDPDTELLLWRGLASFTLLCLSVYGAVKCGYQVANPLYAKTPLPAAVINVYLGVSGLLGVVIYLYTRRWGRQTRFRRFVLACTLYGIAALVPWAAVPVAQ